MNSASSSPQSGRATRSLQGDFLGLHSLPSAVLRSASPCVGSPATPPISAQGAPRKETEMSFGVDVRVYQLAQVFLEDVAMEVDWPEDLPWKPLLDRFAEELQAAVEDRCIEFKDHMTLHLALREVGLAA